MNTSGEAADQVVRMSLEAGEAALKISGTGAQQLAVLLYAVLKEQKKTRGRVRLETLVRSGKPLTVFSVKESDLKTFVKEAKQYGILYCAIRNPKGKSDGMVDIMVKEEDAPRINRIVERFKFASVGKTAEVEMEMWREREKPEQLQRQQENKNSDELVAELLGTSEEKEEKQQNPSLAKTGNSRPSEPISGRQKRAAGDFSKAYKPVTPRTPSVREAVKEIREVRSRETMTGNNKNKGKDKSAVQREAQTKRKSGKIKER